MTFSAKKLSYNYPYTSCILKVKEEKHICLKNYLTPISIESAKVDAKINKTDFIPVETVEGILEVEGGNSEQQIDKIYASILTNYTVESNNKEYTNNRHMKNKDFFTDLFELDESKATIHYGLDDFDDLSDKLAALIKENM
ncbi:sporulation protein [Virgibacillus proomii]|uniref:sporulation protein n=1 Tax=Virgibacillus proomii TaxID=84407 RepID=UPI001C0F4516|nr:sporulation protein [Virgibacillus proomii]MBU5266542.1 sporulation protein [Virgibacillus proomii]